jgi:hypothetical protein
MYLFVCTRRVELSAIAFHHVWLHASIFGALGFTWQAAAYWLIAHTVSGFLTSFIFVQVTGCCSVLAPVSASAVYSCV